MGILVDFELKKFLEKKPPLVKTIDEDAPIDIEFQIQPASVDLRLSRHFIRFNDSEYIDALQTQEYLLPQETVEKHEPIIISPGELILSATVEEITVPDNMIARIATRQSLARFGISTHFAQYMNPGYSGIVPLQIKNHGPKPIVLRPYMRVCTIVFEELSKSCKVPYYKKEDKKYYRETKPEPSKLRFNGEFKKFLASLEKKVIKEIIKNRNKKEVSNIVEGITKLVIAESFYIARINNRSIPSPDDITVAGKNISKIFREIGVKKGGI